MLARRCLVVCAIALTTATGCTSIRSTALSRTDDDYLVGDSNGQSRVHDKVRAFKGVPITLRVPTHVDVAVKERILINVKTLSRVYTPKRILFVESDLVHTDRVFTVDIKRPGAGTLDYTMDFGDDENGLDNSQYFKQLKSRIDDQTLEDISAAIQSVTKAITTSNKKDDNLEGDDVQSLVAEVRTVAWARFDIDAVDFEANLTAFLNQHLNCCNDCQRLNTLGTPPPAELKGQGTNDQDGQSIESESGQPSPQVPLLQDPLGPLPLQAQRQPPERHPLAPAHSQHNVAVGR